MKISKTSLLSKGNASIAAGAVWGVGGIFACPCPACLIGSSTLIVAGLKEKYGLGLGSGDEPSSPKMRKASGKHGREKANQGLRSP